MEHFREIITNLTRRFTLKISIIFGLAAIFGYWSITVCAILVDGIMRRISLKPCLIWTS